MYSSDFFQSQDVNIDLFDEVLLDFDEFIPREDSQMDYFKRDVFLSQELFKNTTHQYSQVINDSQLYGHKEQQTNQFPYEMNNSMATRRAKKQEENKKLSLSDYQNILNFQPIKQNQTTNNIPKFLLKMTKQYFPKDFKTVVQNTPFPQKFHHFFKRVANRKRLPNLKLIHKLLTLRLSDEIDQMMSRKIMWYILGNRKKDEIINNKKVVKKSLYSTSAKVFRLRCRSQILTKRTSLK